MEGDFPQIIQELAMTSYDFVLKAMVFGDFFGGAIYGSIRTY
jgi:hypothetical protein